MESLDYIKEKYDEITSIFKGVTNIETLKELGVSLNLTVEVNGDFVDFADEDEPVKYVRVESYDVLSYIYFFYINEYMDIPDGECLIFFDVWDEDEYDDVIVDITIDELDEAYEDWQKKHEKDCPNCKHYLTCDHLCMEIECRENNKKFFERRTV